MWRLPAFRIALFLAGIARRDVKLLLRTGAPRHTIDQLERSVSSIKANISEGYSKFSGKERARYYETALCSAREAREWYRDVGSWLGRSAAEERGMLLTRVIKILTVAIPEEREGASETRIRLARKNRTDPAPSPSPSPSTQQPGPAISNQQPAVYPLLRVRPFTNRSIRSTPLSRASDAGLVPAIRCDVVERCDEDAYSSTRATSATS
jgi:four helix bundle protein